MSKEMDFFVFLLEQYAAYKKTTAEKIIEIWDSKELTEYIYSMYELYHIESIQNAFDDIDRLINEAACSDTASNNKL